MKKALLLHGTNGSSDSNWLPWLKKELQAEGWHVWTPDLPQANEPNTARYNEYILANKKWIFDDETVIVGHSSGALAALGVLQILPSTMKIKEVVLVGSFKDDLGWSNLGGLFETPYNFEKIRTHANQFTLFHSNDDPYCPLDHAEYLAEVLAGSLHMIPNQKHFSAETDPKYVKFPLLKSYLLSD